MEEADAMDIDEPVPGQGEPEPEAEQDQEGDEDEAEEDEEDGEGEGEAEKATDAAAGEGDGKDAPTVPKPRRARKESSVIQSYQEKSEGYFKLEGAGWSLVVPLYKAYLGRNPPNEDPQSDIHVGNSTIISRRHAKIEYDFDRKRFTLKCESKNGLKLNGVSILPNHGLVPLESLDIIRIADVDLCFLLPYKSAKQNNKNRAQAQRSAKKYQEIREKRAAMGEDVGAPKVNHFNVTPSPNTVTWASIRREQEAREVDEIEHSEESVDSEDESEPPALTKPAPTATLEKKEKEYDQRKEKEENEVIDLSGPPTKKRKVDKKAPVYKEDDSDEEFERLSTKRTSAASRLQRRVVSMEGWSEERKAMWTSNQLDINPEPYYFEYNEPGEIGLTGPWTTREESLFWARFKEVGVDGWWGNFSVAIPGRTGRQCKEFYETLVAQGRVIDDRYVIEDGKAVQVKNEASRKPYRVLPNKAAPSTISPPPESAEPSEVNDEAVVMPKGQIIVPASGTRDDPMDLDEKPST